MTNEEAISILKYELDGEKAPFPNITHEQYRDALDMAYEALKHFKKGHFEYDEEACEYFCSECGHFTASEFDMEDEPFEFNGMRGWALKTPHYCKHCGAYMRGEEDDERRSN